MEWKNCWMQLSVSKNVNIQASWGLKNTCGNVYYHHITSEHSWTLQTTHLALGTQRMYMQPILFPRLDRVRKTSVVSSSLCEYWNSARSVRWSFHLPSTAPVPETDAPLRPRTLEVPVALCGGGPASSSGRKAYVGSGGRKASLAAMRLGQGGQQNRQQSSLSERPFILHTGGGWQEDHCAAEAHTKTETKQRHTYWVPVLTLLHMTKVYAFFDSMEKTWWLALIVLLFYS